MRFSVTADVCTEPHPKITPIKPSRTLAFFSMWKLYNHCNHEGKQPSFTALNGEDKLIQNPCSWFTGVTCVYADLII